MTAAEFRTELEAKKMHQEIIDIFYTTDLRLPPGVLVPRDHAMIEKWLNLTKEETK